MPRISPGVICQPVPDGAVLFHTVSEVYFGLNEVGHRIWLTLSSAEDMQSVYEEVAAHYPDADAATIRSDVDRLIDDLVEFELLERAAD